MPLIIREKFIIYFHSISQQMHSIKYNSWQVPNSYVCHPKGVYYNKGMQVQHALTAIIKISKL